VRSADAAGVFAARAAGARPGPAQAAVTWPGLKPSTFRMPILIGPAAAAPRITLTTISKDSTRPMTPR
jgi:hypothetical protein